jgi:RNA polymerase sigma factor (sigma-70 family)
MTHGSHGSLFREIRRLYEDGAIGGQSDAQLLDRFRTHRDRAAFEVLVGRHGRMVLAVCREVLGDPDDAEDAFQATFLLLARKAGSLRVDRTLAGWLHRVGYRVAVQAGIAAGRRRRHEERAAALASQVVERPVDAVVEAAESRGVLHAELDRLPDRLRLPVVLYYLEGRSYAEAATLLGVPEATVRGRLVRARDRLRDRLTRRGLAPAEASSRLVPPPAPGISVVPPGLVALTTRAASCVTLTPAGTASSLALMQEVLGTMLASKLKAAAAGLAAILALAWMTATFAAPAAQDEPHPAAHPQATGQSPPAKKLAVVVHYAGRVLGPDEQPIAGATIFLHYATPKVRRFSGRARTDAEGRFQFDVDPTRLGKEVGDTPLRSAYLYAKAEGYGPVSIPAAFPQPEASVPPQPPLDQIVFRLPRDDFAVEGQILDERGMPAGEAWINPIGLFSKQSPEGDPLNWSDPGVVRSLEDPVGNLGHYGSLALIDSVKTDTEGRFRITGPGRERAVVLQIVHPGSSSERVEVITRPGRSPLMVAGESPIDGRSIIRYDAAHFVHQLPEIEPRIRTVYVNVRRRGRRADSVRLTEWFSRQLTQATKLKVIANPKEADLILEGTINEALKTPPDQPNGPRP